MSLRGRGRWGCNDGKLRKCTNVVSQVNDHFIEIFFERPGEERNTTFWAAIPKGALQPRLSRLQPGGFRAGNRCARLFRFRGLSVVSAILHRLERRLRGRNLLGLLEDPGRFVGVIGQLAQKLRQLDSDVPGELMQRR